MLPFLLFFRVLTIQTIFSGDRGTWGVIPLPIFLPWVLKSLLWQEALMLAGHWQRVDSTVGFIVESHCLDQRL